MNLVKYVLKGLLLNVDQKLLYFVMLPVTYVNAGSFEGLDIQIKHL